MLLVIFVLFAITVLILYKHRLGYWKRRGIPGPEPTLFLGHMAQLGSHFKPDCFQLRKWTQQYGKCYGIQMGWRNILVTSDPRMVSEMVGDKFDRFHERMAPPIRENVDDDADVHVFRARGKRWKRLRTLSSSAFSMQSLKKIVPILNDSALETINFLERPARTGETFNIHPFFHEFTMDTICRIAMGQTDSRQFRNELTQILLTFLSQVNNNFIRASWIAPGLKGIAQPLAMAFFKLRNGHLFPLRQKCTEAVMERKRDRANGDHAGTAVDFIDMFLDAESEAVAAERTGLYDKTAVHVVRRLTTDEVIAQCFVFMVAGFDTTANTLAMTAFYLALYPRIQDELREEIEENCVNSAPEYEEINKLKLGEALMKEVLRLHPVATGVFNRTAACDTTLGDVPIEAGTHVQVDTISLHRDKSVWGEDADQFNPHRWLTGKPMPPLYGFGGGPRICIGMRLAYLEEKLCLVHILRRFRIVKTTATVMPDFTGLVVLNPSQVNIKLEEL